MIHDPHGNVVANWFRPRKVVNFLEGVEVVDNGDRGTQQCLTQIRQTCQQKQADDR